MFAFVSGIAFPKTVQNAKLYLVKHFKDGSAYVINQL